MQCDLDKLLEVKWLAYYDCPWGHNRNRNRFTLNESKSWLSHMLLIDTRDVLNALKSQYDLLTGI